MQTGRAIIIAAVIVAGVGSATAFLVQPRYTLGNPGGGVTVRLDRRSGDMLGCAALDCSPIVKGDKPIPAASRVPPPPPGFVLDPPANAS